MALLPHDILREIGRYWAGHRLLYTCTALYASWDYADHLITECRVNIENIEFEPPFTGGYDVKTTITTNCMPNGAFHGKCTAAEHICPDVLNTEIIIYDRGRFLTVTHFNDIHYVVATIIDGWLCTWSTDGGDEYTVEPADDVMGSVAISWSNGSAPRAEYDNVPYGDHIAVMRDMVAQTGERGNCFKVQTALSWGEQMPGTQR